MNNTASQATSPQKGNDTANPVKEIRKLDRKVTVTVESDPWDSYGCDFKIKTITRSFTHTLTVTREEAESIKAQLDALFATETLA